MRALILPRFGGHHPKGVDGVHGGAKEAACSPQSSRARALSIPAAGYTQIRSRTFAGSEVGPVTSRLTLDVRVPSNQQNPSWFGDVQAYFSSPSAGLNNLYIGQVSLGGAFFDEYGVVTFTLPASVVGALGANRTDCQLTLALNAGSNGARYQFDHLAFAP
jgi:hypothetical protein